MECKHAERFKNPFPGLRPFRADEGFLFFGRESQVDLLVDKLAKRRFLAVVGTSGSGKSSLVNCGLHPALHRGLMTAAGTRWRMVQFRPGNNPLRAMARALAEDDTIRGNFPFDLSSLQVLIEASLSTSKRGLSEVCERAHFPQETNLLIVVDQFEELFRYREIHTHANGDVRRRREEATAFVNLLLDAKAQTEYPIYIAVTMRSDSLGECAEFVGLPEAINDGQYLVPRLTRDERRAAIAGPVGVGGARISPLLLTRLVNDVGDNPDQLSILQHSMNRTWARWKHEGKADGELDLDDYEAIGTMSHALDQHAEKAFRELSDPRQQTICEKIFKALTDKKTDPGIRRPAEFAKLCEVAEASPEEVTVVIDIFRKPSRSFLMPPLPEALKAETVVDISHESLMRLWERLKRWTDEEVQSAQLYRRLSETATLHAAGKAALWDDPDLQFALDWKTKERPTASWAELYGRGFDQAMSFLADSQEQRDKGRQAKKELQQRELQQAQALAEERQKRIDQQTQTTRRLRMGVAVLIGVVALLALAGVYAKRQELIAKAASAEADHQARAANDAKRDAEVAKNHAIRAEREAVVLKDQAVNARDEMLNEALRERNANLMSLSTESGLIDMLINDASPHQAAQLRTMKGSVLLQLGDYEDAEKLFTGTINLVPNDFDARGNRGYLFLVQSHPRAALKDFEYIRKNINAQSPVNYLNLGVAQAELGRYDRARISLNKAIKNVQPESPDDIMEVAIPSDITLATGRTTLHYDKATFEAALYYMLANVEAYAGHRDDFERAIARADTNAKHLSKAEQKDAYFVAMTWAWLHLGARCSHPDASCQDYGALVSQAVLWEKAELKDWAACYYQKFEEDDSRWQNPKYTSWKQLAETKARELDTQPSEYCRKAPEPNIMTRETQALEAMKAKGFKKADDAFSDAWAATDLGGRMRLLAALYDSATNIARSQGWTSGEAKDVFAELQVRSGQVLDKDRGEAKAHYYRAVAQAVLGGGSSSSEKAIQAEIQRALALNPGDLDALSLLDEMTPDYQRGPDIDYLKVHRSELARYYKMWPYTSIGFLHQAKLAQADNNYDAAEEFINAAIAMEPENVSLYLVRREIENSRGKTAVEVQQNYRRGLYQAKFTLQRRGIGEDDPRLATIVQMINAERPQNSAGK